MDLAGAHRKERDLVARQAARLEVRARLAREHRSRKRTGRCDSLHRSGTRSFAHRLG
jgi:hypothetical protein